METVSWQSQHYLEPYATSRKMKLPAKLKRLGLFDEDREVSLLDTCCGGGDVLQILKQNGFKNLTGIDQHAIKNERETEINFIVGDVLKMPFPDNTFDVVLNMHALHHMGNAETTHAFFLEVRRVLKPGGKFLIVDFPASLQIKLLFNLLRTRLFDLIGSLRNFADILNEEWSYLAPYLKDWLRVKRIITNGPMVLVKWNQRFFLYYLSLKKEL
jgi:ubiquinone/menaquinone biosynthesis C-methylase UbiE